MNEISRYVLEAWLGDITFGRNLKLLRWAKQIVENDQAESST